MSGSDPEREPTRADESALFRSRGALSQAAIAGMQAEKRKKTSTGAPLLANHGPRRGEADVAPFVPEGPRLQYQHLKSLILESHPPASCFCCCWSPTEGLY